MEYTDTPLGLRLFIGALAGSIVGLVVVPIFDRSEPPVPISSIFPPVLIGATIGAVLAMLAGTRRVSAFWPYFVVVFGLITIMPWWWSEKTHSYLPLGTIYVNGARTEAMLWVVVPHLLISLVLAGGLAAVHRWLFARTPG